jgi:hypothetical protein
MNNNKEERGGRNMKEEKSRIKKLFQFVVVCTYFHVRALQFYTHEPP